MKKHLLCFLIAGLLLCPVVLAHPGGTDGNGGHFDCSAGEYHYHHGYEAHQHINGECPFDFHDQTGLNSGISSGSSNEVSKTPQPSSPLISPKPEAEEMTFFDGLLNVLKGFFYVIILPVGAYLLIESVINRIFHRR